jgi:hypothetical protein
VTQFPAQLESGISLFHHRSIGEWHRGDMSSRELLALIEELPETSTFKIARDRTLRICSHGGDRECGHKLEFYTFAGRDDLPDCVEHFATVIDWTKAEHVQARIAREVAASRGGDVDFTGLIPPVDAVIQERQERVEDDRYERARAAAMAQLTRPN